MHGRVAWQSFDGKIHEHGRMGPTSSQPIPIYNHGPVPTKKPGSGKRQGGSYSAYRWGYGAMATDSYQGPRYWVNVGSVLGGSPLSSLSRILTTLINWT